jgi:hypothetical protein
MLVLPGCVDANVHPSSPPRQRPGAAPGRRLSSSSADSAGWRHHDRRQREARRHRRDVKRFLGQVRSPATNPASDGYRRVRRARAQRSACEDAANIAILMRRGETSLLRVSERSACAGRSRRRPAGPSPPPISRVSRVHVHLPSRRRALARRAPTCEADHASTVPGRSPGEGALRAFWRKDPGGRPAPKPETSCSRSASSC